MPPQRQQQQSHSDTKRLESFVVAKLAEIQPYDVVVDPICRRGTILIEAAKYWPMARYIGMDDQIGNIEHARMNADSTQTTLELYHYKSRHGRDCGTRTTLDAILKAIPTAGSVDKVVTCLPFGKTSDEYAALLKSWTSLFKSASGVSLLLVIDTRSLEALELAFENVNMTTENTTGSTLFYRFKKCITSLRWGGERTTVVRIWNTLSVLNDNDTSSHDQKEVPVPVFCSDEWARQRREQVSTMVPVQHAPQNSFRGNHRANAYPEEMDSMLERNLYSYNSEKRMMDQRSTLYSL